MIVLMGYIHLAPSDVDHFLESMKAIAAGTRQEQGCLFYYFVPADRDHGTILVAQRWQNAASVSAHIAGPQAASFAKRWGDKVRVDVQPFEAVGG